MKRGSFLLYLLIFTGFLSFSQAPKLINYQGVARDASGNILTAPVKIKFELFPAISGGVAAFSETQSITTTSLGVFSTQIGKVNPLNINWSQGNWFLEVSIDVTNTGSSFTILGRQQLVSVPFALYAENAGSAPSQSLQLTGNSLSISGGNTVALPSATNYSAGAGIGINSGTINNTAPDQVVVLSAGNNVDVTGTYPNFSISSTPSLSLSGNLLSISGNSTQVTLPTGTTYTNGTDISITSGSIINNTAPDQTVTLSQGNNISVSGTYPAFSIASNPSLSISGNTISISGSGNSVTLPPVTTYTNGTGISITSGSVITNTQPNQTVTLSGSQVSGAYPNYTITAPPSTSISGTSNITISGTSPSYTVNLSPTGVSSGTYGTSPNVVPVFSVDANGRLTSASNYTLPTTLGGNVQGAFGSTTVTALQNINVSTVTPTFGQVLGFTGSSWGPQSLNTTLSFNNGTLTVGANTTLIPGGSLWSPVTNGIATTNSLNYVGIGDNAPTNILHTSGANVSTNYSAIANSPQTNIRIHNDNTTNNNYEAISFTTKSTASGIYESAKIVGINTDHTNGSVAGDMILMTRNNAAINEVMRLNSAGNVGIGITNPAERLEVSGNIQIPAANEFQYSAPKTHYLSIPAMAFTEETTGSFQKQEAGNGIYINGGINGFTYDLTAPVFLPDNATVTSIELYFTDNDAAYNFGGAFLVRQQSVVGASTNVSTSMATLPISAGGFTTIQKYSTSAVSSPVIDNFNYQYFARVRITQSTTPTELRFYRFLITYTVSKAD